MSEPEPDRSTLVAVRGVSKTFPGSAVPALDDISLDVGTGEFFTLLGPSGCGKTTLLRLLAGFEHPDAGEVSLDGRSILADPPNRRPVNIVFQSYALFPHMSVAANVRFGLENLGIRGPALTARTSAALRLVQLEHLAERRPPALSGGQQQRVALARALAPQPRLLLLDEPMSALDPKLRRDTQVELKRIQRETGITFLLVTHDQDEALSLSDRIAVMEGGRIRQIGSPAEIYRQPASRFVADFMGANVVPGDRVGRNAPHVAIRPELVAVARQTAEAGRMGLPGRVHTLTFLGHRSACAVILDGGGLLHVERDDLPFGLAAGEAVVCRVAEGALVDLHE